MKRKPQLTAEIVRAYLEMYPDASAEKIVDVYAGVYSGTNLKRVQTILSDLDSRQEPRRNVPAELQVITARDLSESDLPPLTYRVEQVISHGVTIISARSKMFKSWLSMQLCLCVTMGLRFLGFETHSCEALYIDLENDLRITKERLSLMLGGKEPPDNFFIVNEVPALADGLIVTLDAFIKKHPAVKLIVIDIFAKVKYTRKSTETDYEADYRSIAEIKAFAAKNDLAVILIAHNRKAVDVTDPFSNILGSTALMGATDASIVIYKENRRDKESTISITGRTVQAQDYKGYFDTDAYQWKLLGTLDDYEETQAEKAYREEPVVVTVKRLVADGGGVWTGRINELIEESRNDARMICDSAQAIGRNMSKITAQLRRYDGIIVRQIGNGTGSKRYEFKRLSKNN